MNQKAVDLSQVQVLVLDEADRMLDMGFLPSVRRIVEATPKTARHFCSRPPSDRRARPGGRRHAGRSGHCADRREG